MYNTPKGVFRILQSHGEKNEQVINVYLQNGSKILGLKVTVRKT